MKFPLHLVVLFVASLFANYTVADATLVAPDPTPNTKDTIPNPDTLSLQECAAKIEAYCEDNPQAEACEVYEQEMNKPGTLVVPIALQVSGCDCDNTTLICTYND